VGGAGFLELRQRRRGDGPDLALVLLLADADPAVVEELGDGERDRGRDGDDGDRPNGRHRLDGPPRRPGDAGEDCGSHPSKRPLGDPEEERDRGGGGADEDEQQDPGDVGGRLGESAGERGVDGAEAAAGLEQAAADRDPEVLDLAAPGEKLPARRLGALAALHLMGLAPRRGDAVRRTLATALPAPETLPEAPHPAAIILPRSARPSWAWGESPFSMKNGAT
jgi:hypothetical protein